MQTRSIRELWNEIEAKHLTPYMYYRGQVFCQMILSKHM